MGWKIGAPRCRVTPYWRHVRRGSAAASCRPRRRWQPAAELKLLHLPGPKLQVSRAVPDGSDLKRKPGIARYAQNAERRHVGCRGAGDGSWQSHGKQAILLDAREGQWAPALNPVGVGDRFRAASEFGWIGEVGACARRLRYRMQSRGRAPSAVAAGVGRTVRHHGARQSDGFMGR